VVSRAGSATSAPSTPSAAPAADHHDLQDIEALCRRVIVIDHGTAVFDERSPTSICVAAPPGRSSSTWSARPPIRSRGRDAAGRGPAAVAVFPGRRERGADRGRRRRVVRHRRPLHPGPTSRT
jgi:hypothetical protein